eukprot:scaffold1254_cov251-Pinguiococcus_pyrenoidosus.AAC.25
MSDVADLSCVLADCADQGERRSAEDGAQGDEEEPEQTGVGAEEAGGGVATRQRRETKGGAAAPPNQGQAVGGSRCRPRVSPATPLAGRPPRPAADRARGVPAEGLDRGRAAEDAVSGQRAERLALRLVRGQLRHHQPHPPADLGQGAGSVGRGQLRAGQRDGAAGPGLPGTAVRAAGLGTSPQGEFLIPAAEADAARRARSLDRRQHPVVLAVSEAAPERGARGVHLLHQGGAGAPVGDGPRSAVAVSHRGP